MKKFVQLCCMFLSTGILHAQSTLQISTNYKQTCYWSDSKSTFSECGNNEDYSSLFTLNASETMFTHTTSDVKSTYYVKNKEYKSEYDSYVYNVTSDVGNKYTFIIALKNKLVKILSSGHTNPGDDYLIKFSIKNSWND